MRKLIYKITAFLLKKQYNTGKHTQGSPYNEWCYHCRATETVTFLDEITQPPSRKIDALEQATMNRIKHR